MVTSYEMQATIIPFNVILPRFKIHFFPSTISDWNALPDHCKNTPSLLSFINSVHRLYPVPSSSKRFTFGKRKENILLARLRNECSNLNHHLHINHITQIPYCSNHPNIVESNYHYLFSMYQLHKTKKQNAKWYRNRLK